MSNELSLICIDDLLTDDDKSYLESIGEEISDTMNKRQIHRTETEMRVSVLQDGKHPTPAAKYWQSVREQGVMVDGLIQLGFSYRRLDVKYRKAKAELLTTTGFKREELEIDIEEMEVAKMNTKAQAFDRMREVKLWSKIKQELDNGSFNTQNVDDHQKDSLMKTLENRAKALTESSSQAEIINVLGPLETIQKLNGVKSIQFTSQGKIGK